MIAGADIPLPPLPVRPRDGHKGTFGTVVVVGGDGAMPGAPCLTARAALRSGCGLVRLAVAPALLPTCLAIEPSAIGIIARTPAALVAALPERAVLAIGPGWGTARPRLSWLRALLATPHPAVIDADGLNLLPAARAQRTAPTVLTPHPSEAARLARAWRLDVDPLARDAAGRRAAALALARHAQAVVVLKGAATVIAHGDRCAVNRTGGPALATAGSGDVLTGAIAGLLAQGMDAAAAARLGVHLHGAAADRWSRAHGDAGLLARDLADLLPDARRAYRAG